MALVAALLNVLVVFDVPLSQGQIDAIETLVEAAIVAAVTFGVAGLLTRSRVFSRETHRHQIDKAFENGYAEGHEEGFKTGEKATADSPSS